MADLTSEAALRAIYKPPSATSVGKQIDHLDEHCATFLAHAPLMMLATAGADGSADVSPKGGPPGFARALDPHRLAWADLSGNNRLDSFQNLVTNPGVGLLFLIPGMDETLRVNGRARITTDPEVLKAVTLEGVEPRTAVVVEVAEAYIHCAKAFRRARAWQPDAWPDTTNLPSAACMLRDHVGLHDVTEQQVDEVLEAGYAKTMWRAGGAPKE